MPNLKIIHGLSYRDLFKRLEPNMDTKPLSKNEEEPYRVIDKDLPRTRYMVFGSTVEQFKDSFKKTVEEQDEFVYLQGDLTAANFSVLPLNVHVFLPHAMSEGEPSLEQSDLSFAYLGQNGELCGFSICFIRSLKTNEITDYIAAHVRHTASPVDKREITLLYNTSNKTLDENWRGELLEANLNSTLKSTLAHDHIFTLVSPLFDSQGQLNQDAIAKLEHRLIINGNLDDRDRLIPLFETYLSLARQSNDANVDTLRSIEEAMSSDPNYFMPERLIEHTKQLLKQLQSLPDSHQEELNKAHLELISLLNESKKKITALKTTPPSSRPSPTPSFINRHKGNLLTGLVFAGLAIGLGLLLSGVLAPIGLATISLVSILGGVTLGGIGIAITGMIMSFLNIKQDETDYQQRQTASQPASSKISAQSIQAHLKHQYEDLIKKLTPSQPVSHTPQSNAPSETEDERPSPKQH